MKKRVREHLYEPSLQLEDLPEQYELPYQRGVAFLAKCLPAGVALLASVTLLEGFTGTLSSLAGEAWLHAIGRVPSAIGGQGNISASAISSMVRRRGAEGPIRALFVGDSVFAPNLGGGTTNELPLEGILSSFVPGSLNVSQEGGEWGTNTLLLRKIMREEVVQQTKPTLIIDVNFKFWGMERSFTPAFPIEMEECLRSPEPLSDEIHAICQQLSRDWPPVLRALGQFSGFLLGGLLGQMDFAVTFLQRLPLYEVNSRGWGFNPLRTFKPGIIDARHVAERFRTSPPPPWHLDYSRLGANTEWYLGTIHGGFKNVNHPKHLWLRGLAQTVARWPGPVIVLWVHPSPAAEGVVNEGVRAKVAEMRESTMQLFRGLKKANLQVVSTREVLNDPFDYLDSDHPSPAGHRKLGEFLRTKLEKL